MLLCELEWRGNDATGIAIMNGNDIQVHKDDSPAHNFVGSQDYKDFLAEYLRPETEIVLLHTRFATKGTPRENVNNHPIYAGKAAVVHNGMVHNDDWMFGDAKLERRAEVDSDVIRAVVDKHGLTQDAVKLLTKLNGSAACAIVHPEFPGHLMLLRSGSPLVTACSKDILAFASTKDALHKCMRPYFKKWGMHFRQNSTDVGFGLMYDNSATLLAPDGKGLWHAEFKLCERYTPPDYSRVHKEYRERNKRADEAAERNRKGKKDERPDVAMCPNPECGMPCAIEERLKDKPLWELACEACNTMFEEPPEEHK